MSIESVIPSNHLILCRPLLLLPSIFPSIRVFSNQSFFASAGKSNGASASESVTPMNIQNWFPLGCTGWISLQSKRLSRVFFNTTVQKHQFFSAQLSLWSNSHIHTWLLEKPLLLLLSSSVVSDSLGPHGLQHIRLPCPSPSPKVCWNSCPLSPWCCPTISSSVFPFPSAFSLSQHQGLFQWVNSSPQVARLLELQLQHQSFQ